MDGEVPCLMWTQHSPCCFYATLQYWLRSSLRDGTEVKSVDSHVASQMTKVSFSRQLKRERGVLNWAQGHKDIMGRWARGTREGSQLPNNALMLMWIAHRFTQSTPRPRSTGGMSMCEKLAAFAVPQTSHSTTAGDRARGRTVIPTLRCLPTTPSTCETILRQTIATSANTHKPSRWPCTNKQNVAGALFPPLITRVSKQ